jgi:hypothetical protein
MTTQAQIYVNPKAIQMLNEALIPINQQAVFLFPLHLIHHIELTNLQHRL